MRRNQPKLEQSRPGRDERTHWLAPVPLPAVGLDPAIWSRRVHQVELWRLIEAWNSGRRLH